MTLFESLRNRLIQINSSIGTLDQSYRAQRTALMSKADALEKLLLFLDDYGDKLQPLITALRSTGEKLED